jgi:signal recognition particle GTPase
MIRRILLLIIIKAFFPLCVSFAAPRITFQTTTKSAKMTKSPLDSSVTEQDIVERAKAMNDRASRGVPLTDCELETILRSFENINESLDKTALHLLLQNVAHLSHKDWKRTANNAKALSKILLPQGLNDVCSKRMLHRILTEGNWDGALSHAERKVTDDVPWAVLVTGVNGIRKTTSLYQSWFPALLEEALVAPSDAKRLFDQRVLPTGERAFFRQLGEY